MNNLILASTNVATDGFVFSSSDVAWRWFIAAIAVVVIGLIIGIILSIKERDGFFIFLGTIFGVLVALVPMIGGFMVYYGNNADNFVEWSAKRYDIQLTKDQAETLTNDDREPVKTEKYGTLQLFEVDEKLYIISSKTMSELPISANTSKPEESTW
jgi:uncharacterized protein YacL